MPTINMKFDYKNAILTPYYLIVCMRVVQMNTMVNAVDGYQLKYLKHHLFFYV